MVYHVYQEVNDSNQKEEMQENLNKLMDWSTKWQLPFNINKCKVLHLGKNNQKYTYRLVSCSNLLALERVEEEKDLGIKFDSQLSFRQHVAECVSKANQRIGLIRNFHNLDNHTFLLLYKSLIRPLLEYGTTVCYPLFKQDTQALEKVQRRATKLVVNLRDMNYPTRLRALNLISLVYRRKKANMLQLYRILNGIDSLRIENFVELDRGGRTSEVIRPVARGGVRGVS